MAWPSTSATRWAAAGRMLMDPYAERPTGRGSLEENDELLRARKAVEAEALDKSQLRRGKEVKRRTDAQQLQQCHPRAASSRSHPAFCRQQGSASTACSTRGGSIAEHVIVVNAILARAAFCCLEITRSTAVRPSGTTLVFNAILNHDHTRQGSGETAEKK